MPDTPNEQLAGIVTKALLESGLIATAKRDELKRKLANGTAKKEDWKNWIEMAQRTPRKEEKADETFEY